MKFFRTKPRKLARNLLGIAAAVLYILHALNWPVIFPRLRMKLLETEALVGPSTVIDILDKTQHSDFDKVYVGQTDHGFVFFCLQGMSDYNFSYREATGDLTVLSPPTGGGFWQNETDEKSLPIYVFVNYPEAARAELELTIIGDTSDPYYYKEAFQKKYQLESVRESEGFFRFFIHIPESASSDSNDTYIDRLALEHLSNICHSTSTTYAKQKAFATVRLYDDQENLIIQKELTIRSTAAAVQETETNSLNNHCSLTPIFVRNGL